MSNGRIKTGKNPAYSIPRIGMIKVGTKVKRGDKEFPTSLDYFVATGNYADSFKETFGNKPTKIPIVFVSEDARQVCHERFEAWTNDGKKIGSGDGETFEMYSEKDKDYIIVPSTHELVQKNKALFKRILTLKFVIPAIRGVYGHWEFSTRATKSTINQIIATFDHVKEQAGRVSGIPFDLMVTMAQSRKPNVISKYPVVTLVPNIGAENLEKISMYLSDLSFGKIGVLTDEKIAKLTAPKPETKELAVAREKEIMKENNIEDATIISVTTKNEHEEILEVIDDATSTEEEAKKTDKLDDLFKDID